ncbi:MAG: hypothetical protein RLZZ21_1906 [Planctomycetota bacterium]|jgi:hypothetical protein
MTPSSIPAIVLTCQKYVPLAEHMIDRYAAVWPDHPFVFRLPDGAAARTMAPRHPGRVELVPTAEGEGRGRFRAAVLGLLEGLADDAWVYWCIDDKYVMWLDRRAADGVVQAVRNVTDPRICGLCFARTRKLFDSAHVSPERLQISRQTFLRRTSYAQIWLHQFLRVRVLRDLFMGFPEVIESAKEMDALHRAKALPTDQWLYVLDHNAVVFGESTSRGVLTANCAASLSRGRGLPAGFSVSRQRLVVGKKPSWIQRMARALGDIGS